MKFHNSENGSQKMTFGGHLEVLRRMLFRVSVVTLSLSVVIFCLKEATFNILLAPSHWDFITYRMIENLLHWLGSDFHFQEFHVSMIATELSSQFMTHISTSFYLGLLFASPYILWELFRFVSPALYSNERRYATKTAVAILLLFITGMLINYFILFPISFRFLGTYSVSETVVSNITIDSYISTFVSLTLVLGIVFQLPVLAFFLGKMGIISSRMLSHYRKHSLIIIMLVAAIITPPDVMTLVLVTIPLYLLFELSIKVLRWTEKRSKNKLPANKL